MIREMTPEQEYKLIHKAEILGPISAEDYLITITLIRTRINPDISTLRLISLINLFGNNFGHDWFRNLIIILKKVEGFLEDPKNELEKELQIFNGDFSGLASIPGTTLYKLYGIESVGYVLFIISKWSEVLSFEEQLTAKP